VPDRSFTVGPQGQPQNVSVGVARWAPELPSTQAAVTFEVTVPAYTPVGSSLFLVGSSPELGTWQPRNAFPMALRSDGKYAARVGLDKGATVQLKVTRDNTWSTVERGASAEDIPNHSYTVPDEGGTAAISVATWKDLEPSAVLTGDIRYERAVPSAFLGNSRDVIIYLPLGYESAPATRYPVLYMHDGQNLMDPRTSFSGEWGVDETAQRLLRNGQISPVIIVGVYNTPNRISEYTEVADPQYGGGNADLYARFLLEELKPIIDARYRTLPSASTTGVSGSSLGGLVSLYLGLTHPEAFGRVGALSSSIWWANRDILTRYQALTAKKPVRIWEDMGTDEGGSGSENVVDARDLRDALVSRGWVLGNDLQYLEIQGGQHNEAAWAARFDQVLEYLYPPQ
ncbi:MAG TPA: alpha/beta hydrolase-fold protein, partial [Myxococcales bacterium]|nr:alpha/beta hydrolase-fold protein [Myxococcales bacterium]